MRMVWRSSLAFSALIAAACATRTGTPRGQPRTPVAAAPAASTPAATAPDPDPAAPPGDSSDARDGFEAGSDGGAHPSTNGGGREGARPDGVPPWPRGAPANCYVKSKSAGRDPSPADECTWIMMCTSGVEYSVQCDGENDGTGTSLCECSSGGHRWAPSKPIEGEAPASCGRASMICLATWPR